MPYSVDEFIKKYSTTGSGQNTRTGSSTGGRMSVDDFISRYATVKPQPVQRPQDYARRYESTRSALETAGTNRREAKDKYNNYIIARDSIRAQADDMKADYDQRIANGEKEEDLVSEYEKILARLKKADEYDRQAKDAYQTLQTARKDYNAANSANKTARDEYTAVSQKYGENAAKDSAGNSPVQNVYNKADGRVSTLPHSQYAEILGREDYAEKSKAGSSKVKLGFDSDPLYDYINDINNQREKSDYAAVRGMGAQNMQMAKYAFLTNDEKGVYNYLYETEGKKSAEKFLKSLDTELNAQWQSGAERNIADEAGKNAASKIAYSALTVAAQPARMLTSTAATIQDVGRTLTGEEIDPNSGLRTASLNTQAAREGVSKDMSNVGKFFYNVGMSAADSTVNMLTAQGVGKALGLAGDALLKFTNVLGSAAMSSEVTSLSVAESKEKGYSDVGAMSLGLLRGGIEYLSEKLGGEWVIKAVKKNPASFLNTLVRAMVPEGAEEVMSDFGNETVNIFSDLVFGTDESFIFNAYNTYKANGSKNPWLDTAKDVVTQEILSFAAGALATVGNAGVQYKGNRAAIDSTAKALNTSADEVVKIMNDYDIENPYAVEKLAELHDADSAKSFREAMDAYENAQEAIDEAMRLSGMNNIQTNKLLQQAGVGSVANQTNAAWDVLTGNVTPEESRAKSEQALKDLGLTRRQTKAAIDSNRYEAAKTISTREMGRVYDDAQKKLASQGVTDERLAGAITAVALQQVSDRKDTAGNIEPTKFQQKLVSDSELAQRLVAELVAESEQRATEVAVGEEELKRAKYDGRDVEIVGFEDGKVKIRGEDGAEQTVPPERMNVSYGYGTLLEAAAKRENGEEMLRAYKAGQNVDDFVNAWDTAEKLIGSGTNYTMEQAREAWPDAFKALSDSQLIRAIESGRQLKAQNAEEAAKEAEAYTALRAEAAELEKQGKVQRRAGTVSFYKLNEKKLNAKQRKVSDMAKAVADVLSLDIELYEGDKNTGGVYIQGGKIRVNINSGNYAGRYIGAATMAHEITHALAEYDKKGYQEFLDFITSEVLTPAEVAKLVDRQLKLEPDLDPDAALDEAIANGCAKMLENNEAIRRLAEKNRGLFGWVADKINEITGNIDKAYDEIDLSDDIGVYEAARIFQRESAAIRERWNKMLETTNENRQAEQMTGKKISADNGEIKNQAWHGGNLTREIIDYNDWEAKEKAFENKTNDLVSRNKTVPISKEEVQEQKEKANWNDLKAARKFLRKTLQTLFGHDSVYFTDNGTVIEAYLTQEGRKHTAGSTTNTLQAAALSKAHEFITKAEYVFSSRHDAHSSAGSDVEYWDYFAAVGDYNGFPIPVRFALKDVSSDIREQIYKMGAKTEGVPSNSRGHEIGRLADNEVTTPSKISITEAEEKGKTNYREINKYNFSFGTVADFTKVSKRPNRSPDYVSHDWYGEVSSEYWYFDEGVIRGSTHWGKVSSCEWNLDGAEKGKKYYGRANWSDFTKKQKEGDGKKFQKLSADDLQAKYDSYIDVGKELTDVRNQIRTWKNTADFKRIMDDIGKAKDDAIQDAIKAYKEWEDASGFGALYEREKELSERYDRLRKEYEAMSLENEKEIERKQMEKAGKSEADYYRDKAVKEFGYTPYYYDAGYIVPNGKMLNFSGEKGKHYGSRGQDHRAIGTIFTSDISGSEAMLKFMEQGNIRIMAETPGIDINSKAEPTNEQYAQIRRFATQYAKEEYFGVDFTDERGNTIGSLEYDGRVRPDRVINDIKHFYATGEVREQGLSQFYQKLGIGETAEEQQARKESFDNLKIENRILRARAEYWKAQTRPTKERTVRQQDTDRLARDLLKKYESRADKAEVKDALKELGDWLVQTDELDYNELYDKAEAIAEDIISGNYALLDNSQQENLDRLKDYLKSTAVKLTASDFRDTGDEHFRRKYGRYFTVSENGRTIDSLWGEMASIFGEGVFPEDVYAPGDMLNMIADYLDMWKPQYGNEFELFHDEAVNAATNEIIDAILSEDVRQTPATYADKAQQKLNAQIAKDKEKLDALRAAKNARIEEMKKQATEKNAQIRLAEKAAKYEAVSKVKQHYQDMLTRQRNKRGDTKVRAKIKKLHKELSDILLKPKEGRYVPRDLVKATAEILGAVDTTSGRAVKAKAAMAELKVKYDALAKDQKYALTYDETVSGMLQSLVEELGDGSIYDLTGTQLEGVYNVLKSLKHTIVTANKLVGAKIEADAFEAANQMMHETENAKGIPTKLLRRFVMAQMTPSSAFRAFGGYKKNSMWEQMFNELNNGQLTQTQILMEGGQIFRELIDDKKNMAKLHDQKNLVDIGLKDDQGNAIKVTRGMMLSVYMHLLNEQNARHVAYGGLTVPRLKQYYKNQMKDAFNGKTGRAVAFATEIAELNEQLKNAETVEEQETIKERLAELNDETDAYMSNLRAKIEDQLTEYDRKWIAAAQEFFDVYSKGKLNEVTEMVYGFEKAQVDNYFPIHTDPDYRAASFDTIVRDMNLENAGFMKERVNGANPILLEDITDVISSQLRRTAQYVGLMPAIRNFNKVYGKARAGYSMSVQSAMARTFENEGKKYIENLMADLNGARKTETNIFDELRGNMAGAVLTLNPRVAMAQAASYPTAASEIGYKPLIKALKDIKNNPNWNEVARDEVAKWTPLWWYRMQGFSTVELGDIKNNEQALSKVLQKMKWATGWIQFMDGATTGALWQASKYYVDDNFSDLEKGSDEYMMKVAETFNRVLEKTQPDYTTMQRPDILRNPNAIVKQLTMFMTQRLQNTNILYDAAATYSHYVRDADAGRNGVTAEDVKQARTRLAWAVSSQVAAGATIVIFKAIADAIMHNLKAYRDDDDELTAESVSRTLLTNFTETLTSNILWGSELFSAMKAIVTGERYYGISLNGVDTFKDILEDGVKTLSKAWKGDWESAKAPAWKLGKAIAQFFGIPLGNTEKIVKMVENHVEDAKNGTFWQQEAGVDRTRAQNTHLLFNALQSGDTAKAERIRATFADKKDEQSALKGYIRELYTGKDQKIQKADTVRLLQQYAGMTKRSAEDEAQQWTMEVVTGVKFSELHDKYIAGEIPKAQAVKYYRDYASNKRTTQAEAEAKILEWTCEKETGIAYSEIATEVKTGRLSAEKAIQMIMKYGGKSEDAATKTVNSYAIEHEYDIKPGELEDEYIAGNVTDEEATDILLRYKFYGKDDAETKAGDELERLKFMRENPEAEDVSVTQVRNYRASGLEGFVSAQDYLQAAKMMGTFEGTDLDNDGRMDRYSAIIQRLEYIDTFDLTPEQKTALAIALGMNEKTVRRKAPWN